MVIKNLYQEFVSSVIVLRLVILSFVGLMPKYNDNTCNLNRNENLKNPE